MRVSGLILNKSRGRFTNKFLLHKLLGEAAAVEPVPLCRQPPLHVSAKRLPKVTGSLGIWAKANEKLVSSRKDLLQQTPQIQLQPQILKYNTHTHTHTNTTSKQQPNTQTQTQTQTQTPQTRTKQTNTPTHTYTHANIYIYITHTYIHIYIYI